MGQASAIESLLFLVLLQQFTCRIVATRQALPVTQGAVDDKL